MKRILVFFLAAGTLASCNIGDLFDDGYVDDPDDSGQITVGVRDFSFGVVTGDENFKEWRDSVVFASVDESIGVFPGDTQIDWEGKDISPYESIDCAESRVRVQLKVFPEDMELKSLSITCTDTSLVKVSRGESHFDFYLEPMGVGDTKIVVSVNDGAKVLRKAYPVRVMATAMVKIYIDAFWKNPELCKVRYKISDIPSNVGRVVFAMRDSLAVDAECTWMNVNDAVYEDQVDVKTFTFPLQTTDCAYRADRRITLRNFHDAISYFLTQHKYGSEFIGDSDKIVDVSYDFYPTKARLFLDIFSNNPYLEFDTVVKINEDIYAVDSFLDTEQDDNKSEELAKEHLDVYLCEHVTDAENAAMQELLQGLLDDIGTENQDDLWLEDILSDMSEEEIENFLNMQ